MPWPIGLVFALAATVASAGRLTTFAWDAGTDWPPGTTVELCGNGNVCQTGITGTSATLDLPVNPGDLIQGQARAVAPAGYQCGDPPVPCPYSEWATVAQTWPSLPVGSWARYQLEEIPPVAAPTYVRQHNAAWSGIGNGTVTLTTIPTVGNLLVVAYTIGIMPNTNIAAPAISDNKSNTYTQRAHYQQAITNYSLQAGIFTAPVTTSTSSFTVTINPAGTATDTYASAVVIEVSGQAADFVDLATGNASNGTTPSVTLGARTYAEDLVIGVMTFFEVGYTITPGSGWTQIVEIDQGNSTYQALNAIYQSFTSTGTSNPNWTTSSSSANSVAGIAIKGAAAGGATALPRRALDGPFYGALQGSVR